MPRNQTLGEYLGRWLEDSVKGNVGQRTFANYRSQTKGYIIPALGRVKLNALTALEEKLRVPSYDEQGLVFASAHGTPIDAQNVVNRYYKPLLKKAGLPPIRFHDLRHSCLSLLAQRGEPLRDLQALAGHSSGAFTLQRYMHHYDSSAKRTANAMDDILSDKP